MNEGGLAGSQGPHSLVEVKQNRFGMLFQTEPEQLSEQVGLLGKASQKLADLLDVALAVFRARRGALQVGDGLFDVARRVPDS